jgi:hypothetical protein
MPRTKECTTTPCGHIYHTSCLTKHVLTAGMAAACPTCRNSILTWVSTGDLPCGFQFVPLVHIILGNSEAVERYQLVLLTDPRRDAWLAKMQPHAMLAAATGVPAYVDPSIRCAGSAMICFPVDRAPKCTTSFFLVCLLAHTQVKNVMAMKKARQGSDSSWVLLAQQRYWYIMESPTGNRIAKWVAWLQTCPCGILRAGTPPELGLPQERTAHWTYPAHTDDTYRADVRWDRLQPTEANRRTVGEHLVSYRPMLERH